MGFFDRLAGKKAHAANTTPAKDAAGTPPAPKDGALARLVTAREKLEARDLPAALVIYEELLAAYGDRPDVLVALSGDLGSNGYVEQIVELVAPRYDAERHGPATGLNLLQAYLAVRNTTAAQHLLDILFGLQRPELEERLFGFSNALAELIEAERRGQVAPASALPPGAPGAPAGAAQNVIALASISKPIWAYGVESLPGLLPPKDARLRRIAFGQLATPGLREATEAMKQPEDDLGRFVRGFPLWLSETFTFSPHYAPVAAVGILNQSHYALFPVEWTQANIRQLVDTTEGGLDYVVTGAVAQTAGDYELVLRVWEVKKFRERKTFNARWTPATADAELARLHEQVRLFMEWQAYPAGAGLTYTPPAKPTSWIQTLGASLTLFFGEKAVIAREQVTLPPAVLDAAAEQAATGEAASLAWLTLKTRATQLGVTGALPEVQLAGGPLVEQAKAHLG